ncbi:MAG TPA: TauD/TfdA family dioxygenase [Pyrinomonadaceae bacterium]|jgi:alpha-ketoglutarate-dependent taurine dioxygenase
MSRPQGLKKLGPVGRRAVNVSAERSFSTGFLAPGSELPLVVRPEVRDLDAARWAALNRETLGRELLRHGALLFRGFDVRTVEEFERFIKALSDELLQYSYGSTPRTRIGGAVYTSTEYPADQSIPLHNEMSYASDWPMKLWFLCLKAAARGGSTPIADSRKVFRRISPRVRERFAERGVMYVRNYGDGVDLPWPQVFGTTSREEVEAYCLGAGIEFEWRGGGRLRTRQTCQAVAVHPTLGEPVWFNQAHLFHVSSLGAAAGASLLEEFGEAGLPRNAFYGDGAPIEAEALEEIRAAYEREKVSFDWQERDVLMLDNMLVAHGREPFEGPRRVVVGMGESCR